MDWRHCKKAELMCPVFQVRHKNVAETKLSDIKKGTIALSNLPNPFWTPCINNYLTSYMLSSWLCHV